MLLHKLGHIQTDQRLRRIEQIVCQLLDQLRLTHAGRAHKDEADRLVLGRDSHPVAADGGRHGGNGLVLAHNMALQALLQLGQTLELLLLDLAGRDLRPHLDDAGDILHGQLRHPLGVQLLQLRLQAHLLRAKLGNAGIAGIQLRLGILLALLRLGGHQRFALEGNILQIALDLQTAVDGGIVQIHVRAGFVDQVNGLIGQKTVGDIALAEHHRLTQHALGNGDAVVILVIMGNALQNLEGVLHIRFVYRHRLETALQGAVLLNMLAVFIEGGGANDLNFAAAQRGLQNIGGIHAALGIACTHNVMHLVDHKDHIAQLADLLNETLHAAFKLAAELGTGHQRRQVQQIHHLIAQLERHIPLDNTLRQPLGDGGLAHARLADQTGLFFWRRLRICTTRSISCSRPITASSLPSAARRLRLMQ